jgi:hypothetical protein
MKARNTAKALLMSVFLVIAAWFAGCSDVEVDKINLSNPVEKEKVFDQIVNNDTIFNELLIRIKNEPESMHWMMENQMFMEDIFSEAHLEYIVAHNEGMDRYMMQHMSQLIEGNPSMREQWNGMMQGAHHMN